MTESGCSSSSERGLRALSPAILVSSFVCLSQSMAPFPRLNCAHRPTFSSGSGAFGADVDACCCSGVGVESSSSAAVSSISVVSVPVDDGAIGDGSAMSLGLDTTIGGDGGGG